MIDEPPAPPLSEPPVGEVATLETYSPPPRYICGVITGDPARAGELVCEPSPVVEAPLLKEPVVIDLTQFVPPPPAEECTDVPADPLTSEIVVCAQTGPAPRLGPMVGPVDDGFGSAISRARIKLSDNAEAEANVIKQGVGGFDADGAEVRVKIDF